MPMVSGEIRAVVRETDLIGAIDEVGECLRACAGNRIGTGVVIAAPIAVEIPVGAADVVEVGVNHRGHLRRSRAGLADVTITKGDAGAHDAERRCGQVGIFDFAGNEVPDRQDRLN